MLEVRVKRVDGIEVVVAALDAFLLLLLLMLLLMLLLLLPRID